MIPSVQWEGGAERIDRYEFVYMYIYICIDIFWKDT